MPASPQSLQQLELQQQCFQLQQQFQLEQLKLEP
jgi:hypothetical protein